MILYFYIHSPTILRLGGPRKRGAWRLRPGATASADHHGPGAGERARPPLGGLQLGAAQAHAEAERRVGGAGAAGDEDVEEPRVLREQPL